MTNKYWRQHTEGSPERIVAHAEYRQRHGKGPTMGFVGYRNAHRALELAKSICASRPPRMSLEQALDHATMIARLLVRGATKIARTPVRQQSLLSELSIRRALLIQDINSLDPSFQEIILFGSTAREGSKPEDIDLMVFDGGFYSGVMGMPRAYGDLRRNFQKLAAWFYEEFGVEDFADVAVDLLVFPISVLTDPAERWKAASEQSDDKFFQNALSEIYRFDFEFGEFVKTDLSYFEEKYGVDLSELRKPSLEASSWY